MSSLFSLLLSPRGAAPSHPDLRGYLDAAELAVAPAQSSIERAALAGSVADRLGYAFAGGYRAALGALVPGADAASLGVTESGGGHPRAIATTLTRGSDAGGGWLLRGTKTFATLARVATELLVVATTGEIDGRPALRVVRLRAFAERAGVTVRDLEPTPFAPEIPHAEIVLNDVVVTDEELLPGDGYARYVKPFRTVEDLHVLAAALGHALRNRRAYGGTDAETGSILANLAAVVALAGCSPVDPGAHITLAAVFESARVCLRAGPGPKAPDDVTERWTRDIMLLKIADRARAARTEAAWKSVREPPPPA